MKHLVFILGIAGVTFIFCLIASYVENLILYNTVVPPPDVPIEEWLNGFRHWAITVILVSGVTSLFWYILGQWIFKVNDWSVSGERVIWGLFFLVPVAVVILAIFFTPQAQAGARYAYIFYALDGLLCYYLATVLFSPSSFKFTPLLAGQFWRKLW